MAYRIYTYEDPYKLNQTDFWPEICAVPHFCVARTLVNGLKDVLGNDIQGLLCPLDDLVNHASIYQSWTTNIGLRVQQYSVITAIFEDLLSKGEIDESFHMSLRHNQNHLLDALRLFIELGLSAEVLDQTKGHKEQRLFIDILKRVQGDPLFGFPGGKAKATIESAIIDLSHQELKEYIEREGSTVKGQEWYKTAIQNTEMKPLTTVVIHGVHQFSPAQLRLITEMEHMGIDIIFLFNYQKKYSQIYASWEEIYGCFDVPMHHDQNIKEYKLTGMETPSHALAIAMGEICEGRKSMGMAQLRQLYQIYKGVELREFANITEYAHFISDALEAAIEKYRTSRSIRERGNDVWSNRKILSLLEEQVYTANRDIHTLLKIYYPEYVKDRHFLSYPIGQFFSAIYQLWDYETGEIRIDIPLIKECLNSDVLNAGHGDMLLRTLLNVEVLFEDVTTYSEFRQRIADDYISNYTTVVALKGDSPLTQLKQLSIYNKYRVKREDAEALIRAIDEINAIARGLFSISASDVGRINFGEHFARLEEFLSQREMEMANDEEQRLIHQLLDRLTTVKPENSSFFGTFRDLQEGLYFYLKQKDETEQENDWVAKNFEQIDGDILQSRRQSDNDQKKTYHFACLSDRDMNRSVDELLPWPLTDEFAREAYDPIDLIFQVYYTALAERSQFLRYALFYGLCYNRCDVRLSYVKQYGEEITEPYALLSVLGLNPHPGQIQREGQEIPYALKIHQENVSSVKYDRYQAMDMFLCPYRFFLDYVMEDSPVIQGSFLYEKYYENMLIEAVWKRIENQDKAQATKYLLQIIDLENKKLQGYFRFWKQSEIHDLTIRARNYLLHNVIQQSGGKLVKQFNQMHMKLRRHYGTALYSVDESNREVHNPFPNFEGITTREPSKKIYSLHKVPDPEYSSAQKQKAQQLAEEIKAYLNQTDGSDNCAIPAEWCVYCTHRGNCIAPYLMDESLITR